MKIPKYPEKEILDAIQKEGLAPSAYGYKTPYYMYIYKDGMEKNEIWNKYPSPLSGYEPAPHNMNTLSPVIYYAITKGEYFVIGEDFNIEELEDELEKYDRRRNQNS